MNKSILNDIKHLIRIIEAALELLLLTGVFFLSWRYLMFTKGNFPTYYGGGKWVLMGVYALLTLIIFNLTDSFKYGYLKFIDVLISQWLSSFMVNFLTYFQLSLIANVMISVIPMLIVMGIDLLICLLCSYFFTTIYHHFYTPHDMLLVYGPANSLDLKFKMEQRSDKYKITEIISCDSDFDDIQKRILLHDAVIINDIPAERRNDILKFCYTNDIRCYASPKVSDILLSGAEDITLFDTPLMLVRSRGLTLPQRFIKRTLDIVLSLIALILTSPIQILAAIAIKLQDGGPIFFRQNRVTRNGKVFEILKFRSMIVDAEKDNQVIPATGKDPRITKVGSILRATRIDELPQLINIFRGDMSIVGPRPERVEHVQKYSEDFPEWHLREKVKGGLTGYAQIVGKYNTSAYDKLRLDLIYISNYSLFLDIKLVFMTIRIIFSRESTEGFEVQEELRMRRQELLKEQDLTAAAPSLEDDQ